LAFLVASVFFVSLGNGLTNPSLTSLISRSAPGDRQGGVLGVSQSFGALARIFGPITGGFFLGFGTGVPFLVGSVIMAVATAYAWSLVRQPVAAVPEIPTIPVERLGA